MKRPAILHFLAAAAQAIDYNDTSVGLAPQRFYRVVTPQVP